jgi:hypothetical protein
VNGPLEPCLASSVAKAMEDKYEADSVGNRCGPASKLSRGGQHKWWGRHDRGIPPKTGAPR